MTDYDFEIDRIVKEVKNSKARLVGLQFPEGLKTHAVDVAREIEKMTGATTIIFTDPVYGACDTKKAQAKKLGIDLLIHFGHTDFL